MGRKPQRVGTAEAAAAAAELYAVGATPTVNTNLDAPTIFVDAIQGSLISASISKVCFIEQLVVWGETELKGRYVLNLVIPSDQMRPLGEALVKLAEQIEEVRGQPAE